MNRHNYEAQLPWGAKRKRDEKQIITKQTSNMNLLTHEQRRTTTEEPHWNGQYKDYKRRGWERLKPVLPGRNLTLNSAASTNYKHTFGLYRGPLPHLWHTTVNQIKFWHVSYSCSKHRLCGYSIEPPRRCGSNEYPQSMFFSKIRKIMYTPVNPSFTI